MFVQKWFPYQSVHAVVELFWNKDDSLKCTFLALDSGSMPWLLTSCYHWDSKIVLTWEQDFQAVWITFLQAPPSCHLRLVICISMHMTWFFRCQCALHETESLWRWVTKTHWPSPVSQLRVQKRFVKICWTNLTLSYLRTFLMDCRDSLSFCWVSVEVALCLLGNG